MKMILTAAALLAAGAATAQPAPHGQLKMVTPPALKPVVATDPNQIAYAGHGMLFDAKMRRLIVTEKTLPGLQAQLRGQVGKAVPKGAVTIRAADFQRLGSLVRSARLPADRAVLTAALTVRELEAVPARQRTRLAFLNGALLRQSRDLNRLQLSPAVLEAIKKFPWALFVPTQYMTDCAAQGVPVPPDFATTGTAWVQQGTLSNNMLSPGEYAAVWTWVHPTRRGACVALPRKNAANADTFAGIICQSATTGRACFWDNLLRSGGAAATRIPWSTTTLRIRDLQDGTNLVDGTECTGCHKGNNVYLMSPDDPTWRKLMRGVMSGPRPGTFTTRVEASTDSFEGHPRYIPMAGGRPGWVNSKVAVSCSSGCHERPTASVEPLSVSMPPACSAGGVANCYGTP